MTRGLVMRTLLVVGGLAAPGCGALEPPTAPSSSAPPTAAGRHQVTIAADGVVLGGVLYRPDTTEARPALIVLHGWLPAGSNGAATVEARAQRYAADGYVALALAMRGWFPSGGVDDCGLHQPDDVVRAAEWLRGLPGVRADRVGLVGFSQGGQVALLAAARDTRIRAVTAVYPVTDVARWKTTTTNPDIPGYVTAVCEPAGTAPRSPVTRASGIAAPVLLVHGDADTRVPTEQSVLMRDALAAAGRPVALLLVPGAQHGFTAAEEAVARPAVDTFLAAELR
ncbi:MAG: alpha/beta hydrolase family protein [Vicinamibacterales bacterium]